MSFGPEDHPSLNDLTAPKEGEGRERNGKSRLISTTDHENHEREHRRGSDGLPDFENERSAMEHTVEKREQNSRAVPQVSPRGGGRGHRILLEYVETEIWA